MARLSYPTVTTAVVVIFMVLYGAFVQANVVPEDYDFDSPNFDHSHVGIAFDGKKDMNSAIRSFRSAVRFQQGM